MDYAALTGLDEDLQDPLLEKLRAKGLDGSTLADEGVPSTPEPYQLPGQQGFW